MGGKALSNVQQFFPEVRRVKDADENSVIEVTAKDSASAAVRNHKACAMAVACKRKFDLDGVIISIHTAYLIKGKTATRYMVPEAVSREIVSFDRKGGFAAGEYTLRKVDDCHKLEAQHAPPRSGKPTSRKVVRHHFTSGIRTILGSKDIS